MTYSASIVGDLKVDNSPLGLECGLDVVGGFPTVVLVELLNVRFVIGLREKTLFVQDGQDT